MPNNCSTLIQRKQNILHKILRSNSEGKIQNAVAETTAELCISGTRKTPTYSASSAHQLTATHNRRTNIFPSNRIQPSLNQLYNTHLPSIRDTNGHIDRQNHVYDEFNSHSKTLLTSTSPESVGRPPSASISSIFNALAKQSTENFASTYGEFEETSNSQPVPPSRRSQRPHKSNGVNQTFTRQTIVPQKQSGDSGIDIRFSSSSGDTNQQQQRALGTSIRLRTNVPQVHTEIPLVQEPVPKERTNIGQLYQRRQNLSIKTPTKQKIDKYRRRSEEVTQATNGNTSTNLVSNGSSTLSPSPLARPHQPASSPTGIVRRVSSDGELQGRLEILRLSMDTNFIPADQQKPNQSNQYTRNRIKSPYLYSNNQQTKPTTPISNPPTPATRLRRNRGLIQTTSPANSIHNQQTQQPQPQQQQQQSNKQPTNTNPANVYLAFIASRHLSTLEDALLECDIDHQKLLRIFTWIKGVEDHRHEQADHDQLIIEQNQRMLDQEDNYSLYSEIQHAVDDLPANTSGKPCEKIANMEFD